MQAETPVAETSLERLSPDDLVSSFSKSHLIRWFLAALGLHAIVIGGLSLGTIRDLVDPEGAKARREAAVAAAKAATTPAPAPPAAEPAAAEPPAAAGTTPPAGSGELSPVERATSEAASPDEIPRVPDDLGLSIEDTNPQ
jgi:hypothetical protein